MADTKEPIDGAILIGGPEHREIILVPYDPTWPSDFNAQRQRVKAAVGATALQIEHIGSTAVPALLAKPIVDMLVVVSDIEDEEGYLAPLEAAGYVLRVREPGHRMLRTPDLGVHLHLWAEGDPAIERYLAFRDRLRTSREDRDRYAEVKRQLAERQWPTMNHYAEAKTDVIQHILDPAHSQPE